MNNSPNKKTDTKEEEKVDVNLDYAELDDAEENDELSEQRVQVSIRGMESRACASRIEKILHSKNAVYYANISVTKEMAEVDFDPEQADVEQIIAWIAKAGFTAKALDQNKRLNLPVALPSLSSLPFGVSDSLSKFVSKLNFDWRIPCLLLCFIPFAVGAVGILFGLDLQWMPPVWIQFFLASFVQFILIQPQYKSAWKSLKDRKLNRDFFIVLATAMIWLYSVSAWIYSLFSKEVVELYFGTLVMIIVFSRLGKYIENRIKKSTLNTVDMMQSLLPKVVEKRSDIGDFFEVDLSEIKVGDILRSKQDSRVATDAIVIEGEGLCDERHLTGNTETVHKKVGDVLLAGSMIDEGSLSYQVTLTGKNSKFGDVIDALHKAETQDSPMGKLMDKIANKFFPFLLVVGGLLTFILTLSMTHSIECATIHTVALLVVACPCALAFTSPSTIATGMGLAARNGIIFKNARALENTGRIDTVIFDKTGILTQGSPHLISHLLMDKSLNYNEILQFAASVEHYSEHPFAKVLVETAKKDNIELLPVTDLEVSLGKGIQGNVADLGVVKVGSPAWLKFDIPENIASKIPKILQSSSLVAVSISDIPLAIFAFTDDIREDTQETLALLKEQDIDIILMTGDKKEVAKHIGEKFNIKKVYGEMSPGEKTKKIKQLQKQGHRVAMFGDGTNNSFAMRTADSSFSLTNHSDIANSTASACITGNSIAKIIDAIHLSKVTMKYVKQSLLFVLLYNILTITLAITGFINPVVAVILMSLCSIVVFVNALRLNMYKVKKED